MFCLSKIGMVVCHTTCCLLYTSAISAHTHIRLLVAFTPTCAYTHLHAHDAFYAPVFAIPYLPTFCLPLPFPTPSFPTTFSYIIPGDRHTHLPTLPHGFLTTLPLFMHCVVICICTVPCHFYVVDALYAFLCVLPGRTVWRDVWWSGILLHFLRTLPCLPAFSLAFPSPSFPPTPPPTPLCPSTQPVPTIFAVPSLYHIPHTATTYYASVCLLPVGTYPSPLPPPFSFLLIPSLLAAFSTFPCLSCG